MSNPTPAPDAGRGGNDVMIWRLIWNASEWSGVPLGRFAPYVFGKAIGASSWRRIK